MNLYSYFSLILRALWHWLLEAPRPAGVRVWQILSGGRRAIWAATTAAAG